MNDDDLTSSPAWGAGIAQARVELAAYRAAAAAAAIPVSYTAAATSILASPHLVDYPLAVREWLWAKATRWPRGMEHPHHAISRDELGLW